MVPCNCLIYSTCSVFKKENEDIAAFLRENFGLEQDKMENIKGYNQRADTMFAASLELRRTCFATVLLVLTLRFARVT